MEVDAHADSFARRNPVRPRCTVAAHDPMAEYDRGERVGPQVSGRTSQGACFSADALQINRQQHAGQQDVAHLPRRPERKASRWTHTVVSFDGNAARGCAGKTEAVCCTRAGRYVAEPSEPC
jgi:hypothetical protein